MDTLRTPGRVLHRLRSRSRRTLWLLGASLVAAGLTPRVAESSSIVAMDLESVASSAPLVVVGTVVAVQVVDQRAIYQAIATVRVAAVLRGKDATEVRIVLRRSLVHFDRLLEVGQSGVFLLQPAEGALFEAAYPGSFALFEDGAVDPKGPRMK